MPNLHALTGAYVLDALDDSELAGFEEHLAECAECREEVASLRPTVTRLAAADTSLPPALRDAVLAQVARTAQAGPVARAPGDRPTTRLARSRPSTRSRPSWRRWPALAAAAAVVALAGAGGTAWYQQRQDVAASEAMQNQAMRIVSAPDAVSEALDLGNTHVVMSSQMHAAVLMGEGVPMPERDGMVYQLWMMHDDGSAAPGPTFLPQDGEVMAILEGDLAGVTELAVTVEPAGGSRFPTGSMLAHVRV